jgi:hypothetical protein
MGAGDCRFGKRKGKSTILIGRHCGDRKRLVGQPYHGVAQKVEGMTLYFVETAKWEVREVQGEPWPGKDNEGNSCFDNTHFAAQQEAMNRLVNKASAYVIMSGRDVIEQEQRLEIARTAAAESAKIWVKVKRA